MSPEPDRVQRRVLRLQGYDYAQTGAYFVTICAKDHICLFGEIVADEVRLNDAGDIVRRCWTAIPHHFAHVNLDEFVVMPNHVHGIFMIASRVGAMHASYAQPSVSPPHDHQHPTLVGARHASPEQPSNHPGNGNSPSLGGVVGSFKSAVTRGINQMRSQNGPSIWQRNYYEHIIRDEASLHRIREYIAKNPMQWALDRENPANRRD